MRGRSAISPSMKPASRLRVGSAVSLILGLSLALPALPESADQPEIARSVRTHMDYLAGDALGGRGSGTPQERQAADYVGEELKRYGVVAAGDSGGYLQHVALEYHTLVSPPVLSFEPPSGPTVRWTHGNEIAVANLSGSAVTGPLQKLTPDDALAQVKSGAVVLLTASSSSSWRLAYELSRRGAKMVLAPEDSSFYSTLDESRRRLPKLPPRIKELPRRENTTDLSLVVVRASAVKKLEALPEGVSIRLEAQFKAENGETWNTLGLIRGSDPDLRDQAVLFSAHLDHLGTRTSRNGKVIYHGADDDASGVSAVLELARAIASGPPPRRSVMFAFFGSEERGLLGSTYFSVFPPWPLSHIVAALEFEMLGRPDDAIPKHKLWLSGYELSDLGSELAEHGAPLVPDPHTGEHFFERSDNYPLAQRGVVAHTVSSFGLHRDYHQPGDTLAHIDFPHLDEAVEEMIGPAEWLVNSDFKPHWVEKPGSSQQGVGNPSVH